MTNLYNSAEAGRLPNTMYKECSHDQCKKSECEMFKFSHKENGTNFFTKVK